MMNRTRKGIVALAVGCLVQLPLFAAVTDGAEKGMNEAQVADSLLSKDSIAVCEPKGEEFIVDEVVAVVGNIPVLYSDVVRTAQYVAEMRKKQGSLAENTPEEEAFAMLLRRDFLATCAELDSLDQNMPSNDAEVEAQVAQMVDAAGSVLQLEKNSGKPIFQIKSDIAIETKRQNMAMMMEQTIRQDVKVDYVEVAEFADTLPQDASRMIPVQYSFSQIIRKPDQTEQRKYAIRETLLGYRQRILNKEVTLGVLAQLYSMDWGSARRRGEMGPMPARELVGPFVEAMEQMKPGDISEIVETEYGYHLIELISYEKEPVPMAHFRHILLKPEFTVEETKQVVAQLDSIATEIKAGNLTFAEAALQYSDDLETKQNGGRAFNILGYEASGRDIRATSSRFVEEELMPADYRQISQMKIGEISEPFETADMKGNIIRKIIRLDAIYAPHIANVVDDYDLLSTTAEKVKQVKAVEDWITENISRVCIQIKPEYWDYDLGRKEWVEAAKRTAEAQNLGIEYPTVEDINNAIDEYKFIRAERKLQERALEEQKNAKKKKK